MAFNKLIKLSVNLKGRSVFCFKNPHDVLGFPLREGVKPPDAQQAVSAGLAGKVAGRWRVALGKGGVLTPNTVVIS